MKNPQTKVCLETYGKPSCNLCEKVFFDKSKKHGGYTYYCSITGNDVGQSPFGMNSPRNCPKRKVGIKI